MTIRHDTFVWFVYSRDVYQRRYETGPVPPAGIEYFRVEAGSDDDDVPPWSISVDIADEATAQRLFRILAGRYRKTSLDALALREGGAFDIREIHHIECTLREVSEFLRGRAPSVCLGEHPVPLTLADSAIARRERVLRMRRKSVGRRSRIGSNGGRSVTPSQRARILERDCFRCRRCGCGPDFARLVIDHVIPVALGGDCADENLQTLCTPCNQGKSDSVPHTHDMRGQPGDLLEYRKR